MGYHVINEGGTIPVYRGLYLDDELYYNEPYGKLYNGECFVYRGYEDGTPNPSVLFRKSDGTVGRGYVSLGDIDGNYGNLMYYGTKVSSNKVGTNYRFKLRRGATVVKDDGSWEADLNAEDYVYSNTGSCGSTNPENFGINAYKKKNGDVKYVSGFVTLQYSRGSMFATNFDLIKG